MALLDSKVAIVTGAAEGTYKAMPARVFGFNEIRDAHRLMESGGAGGKIVVLTARKDM